MEIGFFLPTRGPLATPEGVRALARRGEELGGCAGREQRG